MKKSKPKHPPKDGDLPRDEIIKVAEEAVQQSGGMSCVYFKFVCEHCGERVTFNEKNTLYEHGECCVCGKTTEVLFAGIELHLRLSPGSKQDKGSQEPGH